MRTILGKPFIPFMMWINALFIHACLGRNLSQGRKNVLFLVADDMRPQLGAYVSQIYPPYRATVMHTPNIDTLASKSLLLERAYVQQALCGPSRASFLTGRRPDTTKVYKCGEDFRSKGGNFTTLPQYFKKNGYKTAGMGKIFHFVKKPGTDDPLSWTEPYFRGKPNFEDRHKSWKAIPDALLQDKPLLDEQTTDHALQTLRQFAPDANTGKQPFFVAVGFRRPHLPFVFPESYLKYYPTVMLPDNPFAPVDMPELAWNKFGRIRQYADTRFYKTTGAINATTFPDKIVMDLRRAYYGCVSFVDAMIGRILKEVDTLGLSDNTIISFIGDHGYSLGENGLWCKSTNFELSTHAPAMLSIPGLTDSGIRTKQLVEFVDLFPTLIEAADLDPIPQCPKDSSNIQDCTEGISLLPLVMNPEEAIKVAAFSQYPRESFMGYSIRTDRYRYTEWVNHQDPPSRIDWGKLKAAELYDHEKDPEENVNRANDKRYSQIMTILRNTLHGGWRKSLIQTDKNPYMTNIYKGRVHVFNKSVVAKGKQQPTFTQTKQEISVQIMNTNTAHGASGKFVRINENKKNKEVTKLRSPSTEIENSSNKHANKNIEIKTDSSSLATVLSFKNKRNFIGTSNALENVTQYGIDRRSIFSAMVVLLCLYYAYKLLKRMTCRACILSRCFQRANTKSTV